MSARVRRRRALLLLALALASGGLAASLVHQRERAVERRVGPLVSVLVARRDLPAGHAVATGDVASRRVPAGYVPPDAVAVPGEASGLRTSSPLSAGSYLTAGGLGAGARPGGDRYHLRSGERAAELPVSGGMALADGAAPGSRVDVLVSSEGRDGGGHTYLALEDVELLAARSSGAKVVATLRVTARQAVFLAAAADFAKEVRLLSRPPGDRGRVGRAAASAAGL
ncbi:MAG: Flp pilus assembly protein CpaB [Thermoleophilaceae bacterium]